MHRDIYRGKLSSYRGTIYRGYRYRIDSTFSRVSTPRREERPRVCSRRKSIYSYDAIRRTANFYVTLSERHSNVVQPANDWKTGRMRPPRVLYFPVAQQLTNSLASSFILDEFAEFWTRRARTVKRQPMFASPRWWNLYLDLTWPRIVAFDGLSETSRDTKRSSISRMLSSLRLPN